MGQSVHVGTPLHEDQKLPVIAGDPVTVVKTCCDCCRIQSSMVSHTHTTTISTVYMVTIPVAALSTVLIGVIPFC